MSNGRRISFRAALAALGVTPAVAGALVAAIVATGMLAALVLSKPASKVAPKKRPAATRTAAESVAEGAFEAAPAELQSAFERYAVPAPEGSAPPYIALIFDDMGMDMVRTKRVLDLPYVFSVSYLAYAPALKSQVAAARAAGKEAMIHVPMEAEGSALMNYGGEYLSTGVSRPENARRLRLMLARAGEGYVAVNNHMGSKFTRDGPQMAAVMQVLAEQGIGFVDSLTTTKTPARALAARYGVPFAERSVFADDKSEPEAIRRELAKAERTARARGFAVVIAHPRSSTLEAMAEWLPLLKGRGFSLVPASKVMAK